jgi:hypothetical protein
VGSRLNRAQIYYRHVMIHEYILRQKACSLGPKFPKEPRVFPCNLRVHARAVMRGFVARCSLTFTSASAHIKVFLTHIACLSIMHSQTITAATTTLTMAPRKVNQRVFAEVPFAPTKVRKTRTKSTEPATGSSATHRVKKYKNGMLSLEKTPTHLVSM